MDELSPFLDKNKKEKEGFTVPKHYFSNLQLEIMQQIKAELPVVQPMRAVPSLSWWQRLQARFTPSYGWALASVLVAVGAYFFYPKSVATSTPVVATTPMTTDNSTVTLPSTKEEGIEVLPVIEHGATTQIVYQNIVTEEAETYINQHIEDFDTDTVIAANSDALESIALAESTDLDEKSIQQYLEENF